tara:strand:- start:3374 stop:3643 length:270 start_codon:yes stop_codon:yes gene_type:complete
MTDILIYFFICTTIIFVYSTINLMRKIENFEDIIDEQDSEYFNMKQKVRDALSEMRRIDSKEAFEKDDETGTVFSALLNIVEELDGNDD